MWIGFEVFPLRSGCTGLPNLLGKGDYLSDSAGFVDFSLFSFLYDFSFSYAFSFLSRLHSSFDALASLDRVFGILVGSEHSRGSMKVATQNQKCAASTVLAKDSKPLIGPTI